jgi:transposase-like protein
MDGLPGLESAFLTRFRKATVQCCQVHKAKNVLVKARQNDRKAHREDKLRFRYVR